MSFLYTISLFLFLSISQVLQNYLLYKIENMVTTRLSVESFRSKLKELKRFSIDLTIISKENSKTYRATHSKNGHLTMKNKKVFLLYLMVKVLQTFETPNKQIDEQMTFK